MRKVRKVRKLTNLTLLPVISFVMMGLLSNAWAGDASKKILVMSFNVEQLYDNVDNPGTEDSRFLKNSNPNYSDQRVSLKLNNIADVILSTSLDSYYGEGPDVVALSEIENGAILARLAKTLNDRLGGAHYHPIYLPGDDVSGINPGLLTKFKVVAAQQHKPYDQTPPWFIPSVSGSSGKPVYTVTRGILEVELEIENTRLIVFANHWPAKMGSFHVVRRYECGKFLNGLIGQRLSKRPAMDIVVVGDFNSQPEDASLMAGLRISQFLPEVQASLNNQPVLYGTAYDVFNKSTVKREFYAQSKLFKEHFQRVSDWDFSYFDAFVGFVEHPAKLRKLFDDFAQNNKTALDYRAFSAFESTLFDLLLQVRGTFYYYQDRTWNTLDSIQVTKTLFDNQGIEYIKNSFRVTKPAFMQDGNGRPLAFHKCKRKTENGGPCRSKPDGQIIPQDGYSDHFPVTAQFLLK